MSVAVSFTNRARVIDSSVTSIFLAALPRTDVTPSQLLPQVLGWALPPLSEIIVSQIPEHVPRTKFPLPPMGQETFDLREYLTSSNDGNPAAGIKSKHGVT